MKYAFILCFMLTTSLMAMSLKYTTINDIKSADCTSETGGFFKLDTETNIVEASFAGIKNLTNKNYGEFAFVEVLESYPTDEQDALGTLADGSAGFGNASLLFERESRVLGSQKATAFFTDQAGNAVTEEMNCEITFK